MTRIDVASSLHPVLSYGVVVGNDEDLFLDIYMCVLFSLLPFINAHFTFCPLSIQLRVLELIRPKRVFPSPSMFVDSRHHDFDHCF